MLLRKTGRAGHCRVTVGRVTIGFLVNGRTDFARWTRRDSDFYGGARYYGLSVPRLSIALIIAGKTPDVIR